MNEARPRCATPRVTKVKPEGDTNRPAVPDLGDIARGGGFDRGRDRVGDIGEAVPGRVVAVGEAGKRRGLLGDRPRAGGGATGRQAQPPCQAR